MLYSSPLRHPAVRLPGGQGSRTRSLSHTPKPVKEIVADRTATSSTWRDSDGSLSVRQYLAPRFYRSKSGWQPISTALKGVPGQAGWWKSAANSWQASFGPADAAGGSERVTIGTANIGFAPLGTSRPSLAPQVSGATATYRGLWPGADLQDQVSPSAVKEEITLSGPAAPASYAFRMTGASARVNAAGGADVLAGGHQVAAIPPVTVSTQQPGMAAGSGARLTVTSDVIRVSVSPAWLASLPPAAFPVVIDPTLGGTSNQTQLVSVGSRGSVQPGVAQAGVDSAGETWRFAAYVPAPALPALEPGARPWQLSDGGFQSNCSNPCALRGVGVYGLSTPKTSTPTYAQITGGTQLYQGAPGIVDEFVASGVNASDQAATVTYMRSRTDGWWFGATVGTAVEAGNPLAAFDPSSTYVSFFYVEQPPPTTITAPANGSVLPTTTPTFTAAQVTGDPSDPNDPLHVMYDFKISTAADGTGTITDSGWLDQPSWTVPAGGLHDGVTYWATVRDAVTQQWDTTDISYVPPADPKPPISFQVKERLGAGGPSPSDSIGSPPQGTATPSKGSPTMGLSPASTTVNMITGNLSLLQSMHGLATVSGTAGPLLEYNSTTSSLSKGGNYGLTGQYFADSGSHAFGGTPIGQRTDPGVNATWDPATPAIGGIALGASFLIRWTGVLTLPAGHWELGGLTDGGMRVFLNGSGTPAYDDWAGTAPANSPSFGSGTVAGTQQYPIEVDAWQFQDSHVQLWAKNTDITDTSVQSAFLVPVSWLTPGATGLPPGWSLSANPGSAAWTRADDQGDQVVLTATSGDTATFTRAGSGGYQSPPGSQDFLSVDGAGRLQLSTSGGFLYTFNPDGTLASMTTAADDRHPASLQYSYSGNPVVLHGITDPVSGRTISLYYGPDANCGTANTGFTTVAGMLCRISYWDGTSAYFDYNGNGQLSIVISPFAVYTLFGYDSDNRLSEIRDPLDSDFSLIADPFSEGSAWEPENCGSGAALGQGCQLDTTVAYDSQGRVATVTQPIMNPSQLGMTSALRPARSYSYASGSTSMSMAGFSPSSGYDKKYFYDSTGRITKQFDSGNHAEYTAWDFADRPVASVDAGGKQLSVVYDANGNVTDKYGPAPTPCFGGAWPAGVGNPGAPFVGYLPVAAPQLTAGCMTAVPHAHLAFDQGITGLAATYWSNGQFAGAAALHGTGAGGTEPASFCGAAGGVLCAEWDAGSAPVTVDTAGNWSTRLTGRISIATAQAYDFKVSDSQPVSVTIDGVNVVQDNPASHSGYTPGQVNTATGSDTLTAGTHFITVDFTGNATQLSEFGVFYGAHGSATLPVVPNSVLDPNYGLLTSATDADGKVTQTQYGNATIGPELGLPTATITDPGGLALTTRTSYEAPGTGFLRRTATTLPSNASTSYAYYGGTDGPLATACGVPAGTPQGGLLETETDPSPGGAGQPRARQFIYTASGLQAGVRTGPANAIAWQRWQCTYYDNSGRVLIQTWAAPDGTIARTVTYSYGTSMSPLTASVTDSAAPGGPVTSTEDFLGRVISYTDGQGKTTTTSYDQAGRVSSLASPAGTLTMSYDANSSLLSGVALNGTTLASPSYDPASGRLTSVSYSNGSAATVGYDTLGNENSLVFKNTATGAMIAGDQVTQSLAGRDTSELMDINGSSLTNPNPAGPAATDYTYDGSGRLATAYLATGATASYGYAPNPVSDGCQAPAAGADTNRTQVTITQPSGTAQATDYCYNGADQLTGTMSGGTAGAGSYGYDGHGNQTSDGTTTLTWDTADRVASTAPASGPATSYAYDAVDRVISRQSGGSTTGYWYSGLSDSPSGTVDASGNVTSGFFALPGGVSVTVAGSGNTWSYPDLHGNFTATADSSGARKNGPVSYDPWGQLLTGSQALPNAPGSASLGAYGAAGKVTDTASGIIIMGARPLNPAEARFLSVDPIQGGCANAYVYAFGDPLNDSDLTGMGGGCPGGSGGGKATLPTPGYHCSGGICTYTFSPQQTAAIAGFVSRYGNSIGSMIGSIAGAVCGKIPNPAWMLACTAAVGLILSLAQDALQQVANLEQNTDTTGGELQTSWHALGPVPYWPSGANYASIGKKCL
jgi:RHS repeat-associated protein